MSTAGVVLFNTVDSVLAVNYKIGSNVDTNLPEADGVLEHLPHAQSSPTTPSALRRFGSPGLVDSGESIDEVHIVVELLHPVLGYSLVPAPWYTLNCGMILV